MSATYIHNFATYNALPRVMSTHIFVHIMHGIIMPIIIPMYNAHPYFSFKKLALYKVTYGTQLPPPC